MCKENVFIQDVTQKIPQADRARGKKDNLV